MPNSHGYETIVANVRRRLAEWDLHKPGMPRPPVADTVEGSIAYELSLKLSLTGRHEVTDEEIVARYDRIVSV